MVITANRLIMFAQGNDASEEASKPPMAPPSAKTWLKKRIIIAKAPALGAIDK